MQIVLADLLNKPIETPIIFNPEMHLDSEQLIGAWWKNIQNFLQLKSQYSNFYGLQMLSEDYENFVIKALLLSQENNYSEALKSSHIKMSSLYSKVRNFILNMLTKRICAEDLQRLLFKIKIV
ncbi:Bacterial regulatory helix-turn-helix s, AraC family protein [Acinetobacter baumannii]|nr:Bacterial regulatory helix-turn-helix s, AraC family protein [Acinetobacter baumannii]